MANMKYVVTATILAECSFLETKLLGVTETFMEAIKLLESYDYKKVVADRYIDTIPDEFQYDYSREDFSSDDEHPDKVIYSMCHTLMTDENANMEDRKETFIEINIFEI